MRNDYWPNFWKKHAEETADKDPQIQVLRTRNKIPIDDETWAVTVSAIEGKLNIHQDDIVLELCSGNGLLSRKFAETAQHVTSVDVSESLLKALENINNIRPIVSDIRDLDFEANSFSKVIIYAGLQYFSDREVIKLFESVFSWLKEDGLFYIGDIPDRDKRWVFYDNKERESDYFTALKNGQPIIGNWLDCQFMEKLANYVGFSNAEKISQTEEMIYSSFRYDFIVRK